MISRLDIPEAGREGIRPLVEGKLKFSCHRGIACFTACCADLQLVLTPYDILRMKKRLRIPAEEFLEQYTQPLNDGPSLFPMVRLKMKEDKNRRCPLVAPRGCTIYEDRPGACRLYPLGRAAMNLPGAEEREAYFLVNEAHCLGFHEEKEWGVEEWIRSQGLRLYYEMNRPWTEIVTASRSRLRDLTPQKLQMFYLVSYNLDRFREFVFRTKFLRTFDIPPAETEELAADDLCLMTVGMKWLKFVLLGEDTLTRRLP